MLLAWLPLVRHCNSHSWLLDRNQVGNEGGMLMSMLRFWRLGRDIYSRHSPGSFATLLRHFCSDILMFGLKQTLSSMSEACLYTQKWLDLLQKAGLLLYETITGADIAYSFTLLPLRAIAYAWSNVLQKWKPIFSRLWENLESGSRAILNHRVYFFFLHKGSVGVTKVIPSEQHASPKNCSQELDRHFSSKNREWSSRWDIHRTQNP